jgi:hypothetical protein
LTPKSVDFCQKGNRLRLFFEILSKKSCYLINKCVPLQRLRVKRVNYLIVKRDEDEGYDKENDAGRYDDADLHSRFCRGDASY